MDYHGLSRKQLQALCKKHDIPANLTNAQMADALSDLHKVESKLKGKAKCKGNSSKEEDHSALTEVTNNLNVCTRSRKGSEVVEEKVIEESRTRPDENTVKEAVCAKTKARDLGKRSSKAQDDASVKEVLEEPLESCKEGLTAVANPKTRGKVRKDSKEVKTRNDSKIQNDGNMVQDAKEEKKELIRRTRRGQPVKIVQEENQKAKKFAEANISSNKNSEESQRDDVIDLVDSDNDTEHATFATEGDRHEKALENELEKEIVKPKRITSRKGSQAVSKESSVSLNNCEKKEREAHLHNIQAITRRTRKAGIQGQNVPENCDIKTGLENIEGNEVLLEGTNKAADKVNRSHAECLKSVAHGSESRRMEKESDAKEKVICEKVIVTRRSRRGLQTANVEADENNDSNSSRQDADSAKSPVRCGMRGKIGEVEEKNIRESDAVPRPSRQDAAGRTRRTTEKVDATLHSQEEKGTLNVEVRGAEERGRKKIKHPEKDAYQEPRAILTRRTRRGAQKEAVVPPESGDIYKETADSNNAEQKKFRQSEHIEENCASPKRVIPYKTRKSSCKNEPMSSLAEDSKSHLALPEAEEMLEESTISNLSVNGCSEPTKEEAKSRRMRTRRLDDQIVKASVPDKTLGDHVDEVKESSDSGEICKETADGNDAEQRKCRQSERVEKNCASPKQTVPHRTRKSFRKNEVMSSVAEDSKSNSAPSEAEEKVEETTISNLSSNACSEPTKGEAKRRIRNRRIDDHIVKASVPAKTLGDHADEVKGSFEAGDICKETADSNNTEQKKFRQSEHVEENGASPKRVMPRRTRKSSCKNEVISSVCEDSKRNLAVPEAEQKLEETSKTCFEPTKQEAKGKRMRTRRMDGHIMKDSVPDKIHGEHADEVKGSFESGDVCKETADSNNAEQKQFRLSEHVEEHRASPKQAASHRTRKSSRKNEVTSSVVEGSSLSPSEAEEKAEEATSSHLSSNACSEPSNQEAKSIRMRTRRIDGHTVQESAPDKTPCVHLDHGEGSITGKEAPQKQIRHDKGRRIRSKETLEKQKHGAEYDHDKKNKKGGAVLLHPNDKENQDKVKCAVENVIVTRRGAKIVHKIEHDKADAAARKKNKEGDTSEATKISSRTVQAPTEPVNWKGSERAEKLGSVATRNGKERKNKDVIIDQISDQVIDPQKESSTSSICDNSESITKKLDNVGKNAVGGTTEEDDAVKPSRMNSSRSSVLKEDNRSRKQTENVECISGKTDIELKDSHEPVGEYPHGKQKQESTRGQGKNQKPVSSLRKSRTSIAKSVRFCLPEVVEEDKSVVDELQEIPSNQVDPDEAGKHCLENSDTDASANTFLKSGINEDSVCLEEADDKSELPISKENDFVLNAVDRESANNSVERNNNEYVFNIHNEADRKFFISNDDKYSASLEVNIPIESNAIETGKERNKIPDAGESADNSVEGNANEDGLNIRVEEGKPEFSISDDDEYKASREVKICVVGNAIEAGKERNKISAAGEFEDNSVEGNTNEDELNIHVGEGKSKLLASVDDEYSASLQVTNSGEGNIIEANKERNKVPEAGETADNFVECNTHEDGTDSWDEGGISTFYLSKNCECKDFVDEEHMKGDKREVDICAVEKSSDVKMQRNNILYDMDKEQYQGSNSHSERRESIDNSQADGQAENEAPVNIANLQFAEDKGNSMPLRSYVFPQDGREERPFASGSRDSDVGSGGSEVLSKDAADVTNSQLGYAMREENVIENKFPSNVCASEVSAGISKPEIPFTVLNSNGSEDDIAARHTAPEVKVVVNNHSAEELIASSESSEKQLDFVTRSADQVNYSSLINSSDEDKTLVSDKVEQGSQLQEAAGCFTETSGKRQFVDGEHEDAVAREYDSEVRFTNNPLGEQQEHEPCGQSDGEDTLGADDSEEEDDSSICSTEEELAEDNDLADPPVSVVLDDSYSSEDEHLEDSEDDFEDETSADSDGTEEEDTRLDDPNAGEASSDCYSIEEELEDDYLDYLSSSEEASDLYGSEDELIEDEVDCSDDYLSVASDSNGKEALRSSDEDALDGCFSNDKGGASNEQPAYSHGMNSPVRDVNKETDGIDQLIIQLQGLQLGSTPTTRKNAYVLEQNLACPGPPSNSKQDAVAEGSTEAFACCTDEKLPKADVSREGYESREKTAPGNQFSIDERTINLSVFQQLESNINSCREVTHEADEIIVAHDQACYRQGIAVSHPSGNSQELSETRICNNPCTEQKGVMQFHVEDGIRRGGSSTPLMSEKDIDSVSSRQHSAKDDESKESDVSNQQLSEGVDINDAVGMEPDIDGFEATSRCNASKEYDLRSLICQNNLLPEGHQHTPPVQKVESANNQEISPCLYTLFGFEEMCYERCTEEMRDIQFHVEDSVKGCGSSTSLTSEDVGSFPERHHSADDHDDICKSMMVESKDIDVVSNRQLSEGADINVTEGMQVHINGIEAASPINAKKEYYLSSLTCQNNVLPENHQNTPPVQKIQSANNEEISPCLSTLFGFQEDIISCGSSLARLLSEADVNITAGTWLNNNSNVNASLDATESLYDSKDTLWSPLHDETMGKSSSNAVSMLNSEGSTVPKENHTFSYGSENSILSKETPENADLQNFVSANSPMLKENKKFSSNRQSDLIKETSSPQVMIELQKSVSPDSPFSSPSLPLLFTEGYASHNADSQKSESINSSILKGNHVFASGSESPLSRETSSPEVKIGVEKSSLATSPVSSTCLSLLFAEEYPTPKNLNENQGLPEIDTSCISPRCLESSVQEVQQITSSCLFCESNDDFSLSSERTSDTATQSDAHSNAEGIEGSEDEEELDEEARVIPETTNIEELTTTEILLAAEAHGEERDDKEQNDKAEVIEREENEILSETRELIQAEESGAFPSDCGGSKDQGNEANATLDLHESASRNTPFSPCLSTLSAEEDAALENLYENQNLAEVEACMEKMLDTEHGSVSSVTCISTECKERGHSLRLVRSTPESKSFSLPSVGASDTLVESPSDFSTEEIQRALSEGKNPTNQQNYVLASSPFSPCSSSLFVEEIQQAPSEGKTTLNQPKYVLASSPFSPCLSSLFAEEIQQVPSEGQNTLAHELASSPFSPCLSPLFAEEIQQAPSEGRTTLNQQKYVLASSPFSPCLSSLFAEEIQQAPSGGENTLAQQKYELGSSPFSPCLSPLFAEEIQQAPSEGKTTLNQQKYVLASSPFSPCLSSLFAEEIQQAPSEVENTPAQQKYELGSSPFSPCSSPLFAEEIQQAPSEGKTALNQQQYVLASSPCSPCLSSLFAEEIQQAPSEGKNTLDQQKCVLASSPFSPCLSSLFTEEIQQAPPEGKNTPNQLKYVLASSQFSPCLSSLFAEESNAENIDAAKAHGKVSDTSSFVIKGSTVVDSSVQLGESSLISGGDKEEEARVETIQETDKTLSGLKIWEWTGRSTLLERVEKLNNKLQKMGKQLQKELPAETFKTPRKKLTAGGSAKALSRSKSCMKENPPNIYHQQLSKTVNKDKASNSSAKVTSARRLALQSLSTNILEQRIERSPWR